MQSESPRISVGGQAVIEGVMMRSPKSFAVVCRRADGSIVIKEQPWQPLWKNLTFLRKPLLRGAVVLLESMVNGVSALTFSADQQAEDEDGAAPKSLSSKAANESSSLATYGMVAVSVAFAMALFVGAPHLVAWGLGELIGFDASTFVFHAVDGVIKLIILVSYMAAISLLPDIRRVFQYHGAEHKAIFTYEKGLPLTVENARKQTRFHPRCGTSFLFIVIAVSVVIFSATLQFRLSDSTVIDHLLKIFIKIPLMFPVAGVAYELIRLAGRYSDTSMLARGLSTPGMWLQKITTKDPDDDQLEVALISIRKVLWREQGLADSDEIRSETIERYPRGEDVPLPVTL